MTTAETITVFTDGSSRGNPGPGGWGSVLVINDRVIELGGGESETTNNRMELTAVIESLRHLKDDSQLRASNSQLLVYTDSRYVVNGATKWVYGWQKNGWKTKSKTDVANADLWRDLAALIDGVSIDWRLLEGHVGIKGNERADEIATAFADGRDADLYDGAFQGYGIDVLDVTHDEAQKKQKKQSSSRNRQKAYSYVSSVGGEVKTHKTWRECEARVKGVSGARFKKALSAEDEERIVSEFRARS